MRKLSSIRIACCTHTHKEVLQEYFDKSKEWVCLHNDNPEKDLEEVQKFREKNAITTSGQRFNTTSDHISN